ncbi:MAG: polyprenyl synthetase family protein [Candidatus Bilamarchaeaceae archaeon]
MDFCAVVKDELKEIEDQIEMYLANKDARVYGPLLPFIKRGGKRIRPIIAVVFFRAFGGKNFSDVKKIAALIELFHNFTLIHDDIEDDSKYRRGEPTLHVQYGIPIALNSADALYTLVWRELISVNMDRKKLYCTVEACAKAFTEVTEGQGLELYWEKNGIYDITEEDYLSMIDKKTAALLGLSAWVGAYLGGASRKERIEAEKFGRTVGIAFQIQDDVLNVSGDFKKYQKKIGDDITEGKRTLMVIKALQDGEPADKERLKTLLASHTTDPAQITEAIDILKKYGAIEYAKERANVLVEDALDHISHMKDSNYKKALCEIANFAITRER